MPILLDFYINKIGLAVPQGECSVHDPDGDRVIEGCPSMDGDTGAGDEPHLPYASAQFSAYLDGMNSTGLTFLHLSEQDYRHCHIPGLLLCVSLQPAAEQQEQPLQQEIALPGVTAARHCL